MSKRQRFLRKKKPRLLLPARRHVIFQFRHRRLGVCWDILLFHEIFLSFVDAARLHQISRLRPLRPGGSRLGQNQYITGMLCCRPPRRFSKLLFSSLVLPHHTPRPAWWDDRERKKLNVFQPLRPRPLWRMSCPCRRHQQPAGHHQRPTGVFGVSRVFPISNKLQKVERANGEMVCACEAPAALIRYGTHQEGATY